MKPITKLGYFAAACAMLMATFAIIGPRTAHALVATLVQVTNTTANPVPTQDVNRSASQIVALFCGTSGQQCEQILVSSAGVTYIPFSVPADQNLVITNIEINCNGTGGTAYFNLGVVTSGSPTFIDEWTVPNAALATAEFNLGPGHVIPSGFAVLARSNNVTNVFVRGYLTTN